MRRFIYGFSPRRIERNEVTSCFSPLPFRAKRLAGLLTSNRPFLPLPSNQGIRGVHRCSGKNRGDAGTTGGRECHLDRANWIPRERAARSNVQFSRTRGHQQREPSRRSRAIGSLPFQIVQYAREASSNEGAGRFCFFARARARIARGQPHSRQSRREEGRNWPIGELR